MQLPKPDIVRCFFEASFDPPLPAMELRWDSETPAAFERTWQLPDAMNIKGPAPSRFGVTIRRLAENSYQVRVLWNRVCLSWDDLPRRTILTSALAPLLTSLGTDVWYLLEQPIDGAASLAA